MTSPEIATAFVRIRPTFSGFQAEAQTQIRSSLSGVARQTERVGAGARNATREVERFDRGILAANASALGFGRALTFASTAFLGGAGLGAVIRVAIQSFSETARVAASTSAVLRSTGGAAGIGARGIDRQAKSLAALTGVDRDQIKQSEAVLLSFRRVRNEVGAGNDIFNRATKGALDLSAVFGGDVTSSARLLGRALADPVRGVTSLRRANIAFTADQVKLIRGLVRTGQTLQAQRLILDQVEHSVGGSARAIGQTLPGQLNILKDRARAALGEYVKRLSESRQAAELAADGGRGLSQTFDVIRGTVRTLGPPLIAAAQGASRLADAVGGVGPIIAAVAAYKAVGIAVGLAGTAQAAYARATAIAAGATAAETRVVIGNAAAMRLSTTATGVNTLGRSAARASVGVRGLRVATAALGGPIGIASLAVGGLALGLLALRRRADQLPGSLNRIRASLDPLAQALNRETALRDLLAGRSENVSLARFNVQAAQQGLTTARSQAARSTSEPGSIQQLALADKARTARQKLADAERDLAAAERQRDTVERQLAANASSRQAIIGQTTRDLLGQLAALQRISRVVRLGGIPIGLNLLPGSRDAVEKLERFTDSLDKMRQSGRQVDRDISRPLLTLIGQLRRLPTEKEINLVVRLVGEKRSPQQILDALGLTGTLGGRGQIGTNEPVLRGAAARARENAVIQQQAAGLTATLRIEQKHLEVLREKRQVANDALRDAKETRQTARDTLTSARETAAAARETLRTDRDALSTAREALRLTVVESRISINQVVSDAKANLDQLGQSVADTLQKFGFSGVGKQFQALRAQLLAGGGGPETQRLRQQIASRAERARPQLPQDIADLTDRLNRGQITLRQFNRAFTTLIKGFDFATFQRQFGTAAANTLRDQIRAVRKQAGLDAAGPQRAGGVQQTIIRPLRTVAQASRDVAAAQKAVASAQRDVAHAQDAIGKADRGVAQAERRLRNAAIKETEANTKAVKANTRAAIELARVNKTRNERDKAKPKPDGKQGDAANTLTGAGAGTP